MCFPDSSQLLNHSKSKKLPIRRFAKYLLQNNIFYSSHLFFLFSFGSFPAFLYLVIDPDDSSKGCSFENTEAHTVTWTISQSLGPTPSDSEYQVLAEIEALTPTPDLVNQNLCCGYDLQIPAVFIFKDFCKVHLLYML